MEKLLSCLLWILLCCILPFMRASEEELMDFDFADLKEIDWSFETDDSNKETLSKGAPEKNIITFDDDSDLLEENQVHPFDWREKVLRTALSKALLNKSVRQKFIEVMPILRVLSKQQRLALSALITAQINAKKGNELKLDQVRLMFGDDKALILPIVFDIANLVRNSAKKYIEFDYNLADFGHFSKTKKVAFEKRKLDLSTDELVAEESEPDAGILPASAQLTQVMDVDDLEEFMSDEVLDPKEINEELQTLKIVQLEGSNTQLDDISLDEELEEEQPSPITNPLDINFGLQQDVPTLTVIKLNKTNVKKENATLTRSKRSARHPKEFVHKLVRSVSFPLSEEDAERGNVGRTLKLNTTAFALPKETTIRASTSSLATTTTAEAPLNITLDIASQSLDTYEPYQIVEDLALASLNTTEMVNDDAEDKTENESKSDPSDEILPTPEELIAKPRYRITGNKLIPQYANYGPIKRQRIQIRAKPKTSVRGNGVAPPKKCERFTASMCIKTEDYPIDHILGSIRRHRNAMTALLAEYNDNIPNALDTTEDFDEYLYAKKRREDNDMQADLCQSIVRYARPQKARSASGEWKYIVNTGQHTQTLRLEKCTNPQESCSYLASSYRSHCAQVYNYHRLLSWDKIRGLHVDIFKVPTCCSCQIDGYKPAYAALSSKITKGFTPVYLNEQEEEEEEDDDFDVAIQRKHQSHDNSFDANDLRSNKIKNNVPRPTVGSYLSPPVSEEYEEDYAYKTSRDTASIASQQHAAASSSSSQLLNKHYLRELQNRQPNQFYKDSRSDQDISPSEEHGEREVKVFGTAIGKDEKSHQKRKNIYSVTQTANTGSSGISDSSTTALSASTGTIRTFTTPTTVRYRRPTIIDTNAHQKPTITATSIISTTASLPSTSAAATTSRTPTATTAPVPTTPKVTATLQTYYYNRPRYVLKSQSRLRIPYTIPSTNAGTGDRQKKNATSTLKFEPKIPAPTDVTTSSPHQPDIYAVNQNIFQNDYKTKFSLTYTTTPTLGNYSSSSYPSPPKRINYNYHPIIDFFEYNKRMTTPNAAIGKTTNTATTPITATTTTTITPETLVTDTENTSPTPPSDHMPSFHLYPHKIHKPVAVTNYQQQQPSHVYNYQSMTQHNQQTQQQQEQQQLTYRSANTENRIGYGAAAAVAAATDGDGILNNENDKNGVAANTPPKQNTNPKKYSTKQKHATFVTPYNSHHNVEEYEYEPSLETNIWHPVVVQDF